MKCVAAAGLILGLALAPMVASAGKPNFYIPDSATKKDKTQEAAQKKSEPKTEPETKSEKPKHKPEPPEKTKPPETEVHKKADLELRKRHKLSEENFDPPRDPFGVAQAFHHRWDFSTFLITAKEELRFRLDAARKRTLRLARAFSELSAEVERRQRNLNRAALAAYLLSRDQHSWNPVTGRNLTEAQKIAVRNTMQQDIHAMKSALSDYDVLRNALNASAEKVALMDKKGLSAIDNNSAPTPDRPTVPTAALARNNMDDALKERMVSVEALKATLAAENLSNMGDRRQSIASFAPPPPLGVESPSRDIAPPAPPSKDVMKNQPRGESMDQPEKTALVFPTPINAPVHAVKNGVVVYAGPFRGYGVMVIIEHEKNEFSIYSHLGSIQVKERQPVNAGEILGRAGAPPELGRSGIHFQVRKGKTALNAAKWAGDANLRDLLTR